jgi:C4-dicarboxylate-specific signal transduction histidine kinase
VIHRLRGLLKKGEHKAGLISLNDQITSTLRLVHSELVSRRIKVRTDLDTHLPAVMGDRVQLQQVFLNLMMNAMDAMASMPASERTLSINTRSTEKGNVEVSVTDRGPGMSPDQLKNVFEPFFTTKQDGLGLGLAICWRIIKSHNGQLTISNAGGGGVTAVVSLPVAIRLAAAS